MQMLFKEIFIFSPSQEHIKMLLQNVSPHYATLATLTLKLYSIPIQKCTFYIPILFL
jgi:hypothetical protein